MTMRTPRGTRGARSGSGVELANMDPAEITCASVETADGPGFKMSVSHRVVEGPTAEGT